MIKWRRLYCNYGVIMGLTNFLNFGLRSFARFGPRTFRFGNSVLVFRWADVSEMLIRRSNPRYSLNPNSNKQLAITNRHRILRRGRNYVASVNKKTSKEDTG